MEAKRRAGASSDAQAKSAALSLGTLHFQEANELIREQLAEVDELVLENVHAQRYIGCAMPEGKSISIHGVPGNDMAAYMDGGCIEVFGNAQDQIGNTMNAGEVVVHGRCGDAAGYAMRGGSIFIRDDCGWRVGINMKEYDGKRPEIVIGGNAGSFLGEYMAGGIILLCGSAGDHLGTGMHGGVLYLREEPDASRLSPGLVVEKANADDAVIINGLLARYNTFFAKDIGSSISEDGSSFFKVVPESARPYAGMYAH